MDDRRASGDRRHSGNPVLTIDPVREIWQGFLLPLDPDTSSQAAEANSGGVLVMTNREGQLG